MRNPFSWVKALLGILVLLSLMACSGIGQALTAPQATSTPTALPPGYAVSGKTRGDPNAKVTLVEFADFQ